VSSRERQLKITEIFHSIQGEADAVGWPTVFVRLTGCPLRCQYCDTTYSFYGGEWQSIDAILQQVASYGAKHVCVTGGEPLSQKRCLILLTELCDAGYAVSLETSGAVAIEDVDPRVVRVVDLKTPASKEQHRNRLANLADLRGSDQLKFVICDRADYEWSRAMLSEHGLSERCPVLFSPSSEQLPARDLAEWILADRLPVRLQLQLHKILWADARGR
jgi:7-carboxy-7-deazaguanine synthase